MSVLYPCVPPPKWMGPDVTTKLAGQQSQRQSHCFVVCIYFCMCATCMHFHTWEWFCMYVRNDTFPTLIFRTHLREWVYPLSWLGPVWLTDSQELSHSQLFIPLFIFFFPTTLICNNIFWFIGLISLCWWSTEDVKQNLQRVFFLCCVPQIHWPGLIFTVTCTCGWRNVHMQMSKTYRH